MSTTAFVYTQSRTGEVGAWSRYSFAFDIDNFAGTAEQLYIRAGTDVLLVDPTTTQDYASSIYANYFNSYAIWPWLDFGSPGVNKMLVAMDIAATGANPSLSIGYDQSNTSTFTTAVAEIPDTVPGQIIPLNIFAPSLSVKVSYTSGSWTLYGINLYLTGGAPAA